MRVVVSKVNTILVACFLGAFLESRSDFKLEEKIISMVYCKFLPRIIEQNCCKQAAFDRDDCV
jgi:hypothetical protein